MDDTLFLYDIHVVFEFQRGRWIGWHGRANSPRTDFLWPQESMGGGLMDVPNPREVTDWIRNMIHEIRETEWLETRD